MLCRLWFTEVCGCRCGLDARGLVYLLRFSNFLELLHWETYRLQLSVAILSIFFFFFTLYCKKKNTRRLVTLKSFSDQQLRNLSVLWVVHGVFCCVLWLGAIYNNKTDSFICMHIWVYLQRCPYTEKKVTPLIKPPCTFRKGKSCLFSSQPHFIGQIKSKWRGAC